MSTNSEVENIGSIYDANFIMWLNSQAGVSVTGERIKTNGTIKYTDMQIREFIIRIFAFFTVNNMCFSSGTLVFNDIGKMLFNLLTFNQLLVPNDSYYCDNPMSEPAFLKQLIPNSYNTRINTKDKISSQKVSVLKNHNTHELVLTEEKGTDIECLPSPYFGHTKFQRIFEGKYEEITHLCPPEKDKQESETKRMLLYYPFITKNNFYNTATKGQLLFFKLEKWPVQECNMYGTVCHGYEATSHHVFGTKGTPIQGIDNDTGLSLRREDKRYNLEECMYDNYFRTKDILFYGSYNDKFNNTTITNDTITNNNEIQELMWYNEYIRTGCEFYVTKNLLSFLLMSYLTPSAAALVFLRKQFQDKLNHTVSTNHIPTNSLGGKFTRKRRKYKKLHHKSKRRKATKRIKSTKKYK